MQKLIVFRQTWPGNGEHCRSKSITAPIFVCSGPEVQKRFPHGTIGKVPWALLLAKNNAEALISNSAMSMKAQSEVNSLNLYTAYVAISDVLPPRCAPWGPLRRQGVFLWGGGGGRLRTACGQRRRTQSNDPRNNQHNPQYANYWAPLTRKRHIPPHSAQPQHTNYWAPRTRKRHQQEHRPQRPTERSDPTQHAKGRTGDCPGPRKETTTRRHVTQGGCGVRLLPGGGQRQNSGL